MNAERIWKDRHRQWLGYLHGFLSQVNGGLKIPLGPSQPSPQLAAKIPAKRRPVRIAYCAPHPDDESLSGALALRLQLETGARVTVVAVTLGRDESQRERRLGELQSACQAIGFGLVVPDTPHGLEDVNPLTRKNRTVRWFRKMEVLREILEKLNPDMVFAPHDDDYNTTHIGTHYLVVDTLQQYLTLQKRPPVMLVETEMWHQMNGPNLMLGISPEVVATQLVAACEHGGEMLRNPYHILHPCRLMDNVRRGSEVVGGQGASAQPFPFAELYRISFVVGNETVAAKPGGKIVGPEDRLDFARLKRWFWPDGAKSY
ncbi:MAG: PIG-L deacetylase family protein [Terriglobia bacterium]